MEAGRGAYCNPIHARAHSVHARSGRGLSEQSCSLPQTRRRSEGKEHMLPGEGTRARRTRCAWRRESEHRSACLSAETRSSGRTAKRHHGSFLPTSFTHADRAARRSGVFFCAWTDYRWDSTLSGNSMGKYLMFSPRKCPCKDIYIKTFGNIIFFYPRRKRRVTFCHTYVSVDASDHSLWFLVDLKYIIFFIQCANKLYIPPRACSVADCAHRNGFCGFPSVFRVQITFLVKLRWLSQLEKKK